MDEEIKVEPEETPKRVAKPKRPKVELSPEGIESRYQAHLEKVKTGGK